MLKLEQIVGTAGDLIWPVDMTAAHSAGVSPRVISRNNCTRNPVNLWVCLWLTDCLI